MNNFIGLVYATLEKAGIDTKNMSTDEAVKKYNELKGKNETPTPKQDNKELTLKEKERLEVVHNIKDTQSNKKRPTQGRTLEQQVDKVLDGTYKGSHITIREETPQVLQSIGVPNKPMLMTAKHAYLAINKEGKYTGKDDHYHDLGKQLFMKIPQLLQHPAMVLKNGNNSNDLLVVLDGYDKEDNILIMPLKIDGYGKVNKISIQGIIAKSTYGKKGFENYISKNFTAKDLLLLGDKKIRDIHQ